MDLKLSGEEIGALGKDVVIATNPDDAPIPLQGGQSLVKQRKIVAVHPQRTGNSRGLERLPLKQGEQVGDQPLIQGPGFPGRLTRSVPHCLLDTPLSRASPVFGGNPMIT